MKRAVLLTVILALAGSGQTRARDVADITLDYVAKRAEQRAHTPFKSPRANLPDFLRADKLNYDKYREIEFRHERAFWADKDLPFRIEFFHPGYIYEEPVNINEFTLTAAQAVPFNQEWFNYRGLHIEKRIPPKTGYAGFRVLSQLNSPDKWDEVGAFVGASYFRLLGKGQSYGESARGLAIDCGETDRPEEFPIFTDWWLGQPSRDDDRLRLYAILDSVSCAGAYSFLIKPGDTTVVDIEAIIYFRDDTMIRAGQEDRKLPIKTLGMAPLTSMFWFGKSSQRKFDDYRPEVHDSDGLLMQFGKEVLWRPLDNPPQMQHQRFAAKELRGFGLMQRERDFRSYEDLFNPYQSVPSVWVEPQNGWGEGELNLVELATQYEGLDNVVVFWDPKNKPQPMQPYRFSYQLSWTKDEVKVPVKQRVVSTRLGVDPRNPQQREFVIDFAGTKPGGVTENTPPQAIASCSTNAAVVEAPVYRNPYDETWQVIMKVAPKPGNKDPVDIRCTLQQGEEVLSETWTYLWNPL